MTGGLIQLVAYGAQDVYLTANPQFTFFKSTYKRYTNFAMQDIPLVFKGTIDFGKKVSCTLSRIGDLVFKTYVKVVLPKVVYNGPSKYKGYAKFGWIQYLGYQLIKEVEVEIGGTRIDKQYSDWLYIWQDILVPTGNVPALYQMIGNTNDLTSISSLNWTDNNKVLKDSKVLFIPLLFWFNLNNGLALPLISLQYHEVKINVTFRDIEELCVRTDVMNSSIKDLKLDSSLFVQYIFLDTTERRLLAQKSSEYLIQQIQFNNPIPINNNFCNCRLYFNHPVMSLIWWLKMGNYRGGKFMTYVNGRALDGGSWNDAINYMGKQLLLSIYDLDQFGNFAPVKKANKNNKYIRYGKIYNIINCTDRKYQPRYIFDYSQRNKDIFIGILDDEQPLVNVYNKDDYRNLIDGILKVSLVNEDENLYRPEVVHMSKNKISNLNISTPTHKYRIDNRCDYIKDQDIIVWDDVMTLYINNTKNPITAAQLVLNGIDRTKKYDNLYFDALQPITYFDTSFDNGTNGYSFAIKAWEFHKPTGSCNFSRIDTATFRLWFNIYNNIEEQYIFENPNNYLAIYGHNYNILRVMSGMAGVAYSN